MLEHSPTIAKIADALAKAQAEIKGAIKDATNPHFKSQYADLASIWKACQEVLPKNGICVVQSPSGDDQGNVVVTTMLGHSSGEWIKDSVAVKPGKPDAQSVGSVITYLRRYSLAAMAGVAPEDDDGEGGVGRGNGNGNGHEMKPAGQQKTAPKPPPEPGRKLTADEWVERALAELVKMRSKHDVDEWEKKAAKAIADLESRFPEKHERFMAEMTKIWQKLPHTMEAA